MRFVPLCMRCEALRSVMIFLQWVRLMLEASPRSEIFRKRNIKNTLQWAIILMQGEDHGY